MLLVQYHKKDLWHYPRLGLDYPPLGDIYSGVPCLPYVISQDLKIKLRNLPKPSRKIA
jgi:hypothetical protein